MIVEPVWRSQIQHIADAAVAAAQPDRLVSQHLARAEAFARFRGNSKATAEGRLYLLAVGKAAIRMATAAEAVLGERLADGVVISKATRATLPAPLTYYQGDHPIPGTNSIAATESALCLARLAGQGDTVLCLVSGGTSALFSAPVLPLPEWQLLNDALIRSGCTITEFNTVRRHLDRVKGGGLARAIAPADTVTLILSDVIGNALEYIGSGPTVPAPATPELVLALLRDYGVMSHVPPHTAARIEAELAKVQEEAPAYGRIENTIIGDVALAAEAARAAAEELGLDAAVVATSLTGEAREIGRRLALEALQLGPRTCRIYGGESTVTVRGDGYGGRNQEMALAAALTLEGEAGVGVACFSTDGDDGLHPPDAPTVAGAFVTGQTAGLGRSRGDDPTARLDANDSYRYFAGLPGHHIQVAAGTNVNDLAILVRYD